MNITYTQNGDYLIPNIIIRKTKPLGHYGRLRKAYLEMHRPILFNELALSDKLFEHCAEIDEAARSRMELIVRSLAEQNGVTEQLKAENQMSSDSRNFMAHGCKQCSITPFCHGAFCGIANPVSRRNYTAASPCFSLILTG